MIKKVTDPTIAKVLSNDMAQVYRIPRYQREYTWGMKDWANLYDDVFEHEAGYFLGSFIVIQDDMDPNTGIINYEVIDGQQRLTTISLLLVAIYARLQERGDAIDDDMRAEDIVPLRGRLLLKKNKGMTRVVPQVQNHNLEDFRWIMKEQVGLKAVVQKPKYHGVRKVRKAFEYFYGRLGDEVNGLDDETAVGKLLEMCDLLCHAVIVQINVDSHADAYTLFASLNNRGVPLSAVDLIKNTLLSKVADADESELDYYFEQWQEVLRNLGDDYAVQERFFRQNYDAFRREANAPFVVEGGGQWPLGPVATRSNLLKIYETRIAKEPGALGVLDELLTNSEIYGRLVGSGSGEPQDVLDEQLLELSRAQGVPSYLMLLFLMRNKDKLEIVDTMVADLVSYLVRFFVRRNVTDTPPTRDLQRLFISVCEGIQDRGLVGTDLVKYAKERLWEASASDSVFEERLSGPVYDVNPDMCRYILATLAKPSVTKEMRPLWERNGSGTYVWTIEHVFPQGENIPVAWVDMIGGGDRSAALEIQASHVHKLGNLTLTGYNSKLGNMSFKEKRDRRERKSDGSYVGYRNGLNLNEDLVGTDTWTKEQIDDRTEKLVKLALEAFSLSE